MVIKLKKEIIVNNIYNADCKIIIKKMIKENFQVDLILTDPPYNISRKNNFKTIKRNGIDFGEWDKNFDQKTWLNNINKILKPGGSIIIFNDWKNLGMIAKKLEKIGFEIKDLIRWIKPAPMPRNVTRRYVTDFEMAIWAVNVGAKWIFNKNPDVKYMRPEYSATPPHGSNRLHPTQKSEKLINDLIETHSNIGDVIFDPFSGSGQISFSANKLNRFYLGCEIDKVYWQKSIKKIKTSYLKPAFNHLGNKFRMIEDLMREFPKKNIDYFVDAFAGSGIVSLTYKSPSKIFLNDSDSWLAKILEYLLNTDKKVLLKEFEKILDKYDLPKVKRSYAKEYNKLKKQFNIDKEISKLLVLIIFGFNQQIRFNKSDSFNIPPGKFWWNEYHKAKLVNFINNAKDKKIVIRSKDFKTFIDDIKKEIRKENTLFYFDPPYFLSSATYNNSWNKDKEIELIQCLQDLTDEGYKWFLSNLLKSKNQDNTYLMEFIKKNKTKINVIYLDKINYKNSNYQRKQRNDDDIEVLIRSN